VRLTSGLRAFRAGYNIPLNGRDTQLSFNADVARSEVVQAPFADLDIKSSVETYGLGLSHPLSRRVDSEFDVFLVTELRRSQSFLLGSGFRFSDDLTEDGVARVSVLRVGQSWIKSGVGQALAIRNALSFGLGIFAPTSRDNMAIDGRFVSWLGQAQWVRRVSAFGSGGQLIVRGDVQLTSSPLPGLEKFVIGGRATVRGYRENEMVRDNGLVGSIEGRIPVFSRPGGSSIVELAPFVDLGRSYNKGRPSVESETLPSAGIGLRWRMRSRLDAEVYWGYAFREFPRSRDFNLQDYGVHLGLAWSIP
jgi:hemolysin activation/secretion protein